MKFRDCKWLAQGHTAAMNSGGGVESISPDSKFSACSCVAQT